MVDTYSQINGTALMHKGTSLMNRSTTLKGFMAATTQHQSVTQKLLDVVALVLLWPLALVSAVALKVESREPILVNNGELKFRTTTPDGTVTRLGRYLRKAELDRLPQRFRLF